MMLVLVAAVLVDTAHLCQENPLVEVHLPNPHQLLFGGLLIP